MTHWWADIRSGQVVWFAFWLYGANMGVGVVAFVARVHFGLAHHILYFVVTAAVAIALVVSQEWLLVGTLFCLGLLSRLSARSLWHPAVASFGCLGLVGAVIRLI